MGLVGPRISSQLPVSDVPEITRTGGDSIDQGWLAATEVGQPPAATVGLTRSEFIPKRGAKIGHFTVLSAIGEGGMGRVFSAYDERLGRRVAIKLLRAIAPENEVQRRLLREAQALAQISHPNVVQVFDVIRFRGDIALIMEFVEGRTLGAWLGEERRHWRAIVTMFIGAGEGLAAVHAANLVHRDFKPANVLVDSSGRPRIVDFGLAYAEAGVENHADTHRRIRGAGTPAYMAPEQSQGAPPDALADQFSFCVALYEALYGRRPGDSARGHQPESRVPSVLSRAIDRGLSPDPARRWPSMGALLLVLRRNPGRTWLRRAMVVGLTGGAAAFGYGFAVSGNFNIEACNAARVRLSATWNETRRVQVENAVQATNVPYAAKISARVSANLDAYAHAYADTLSDVCARGRDDALTQVARDHRMACLERRRTEFDALLFVLESADATVVQRAVQATGELVAPRECDSIPRKPVEPSVEPIELRRDLALAHAYQRAGKYTEGLAIAERAMREAVRLGSPRGEAEALTRIGYLQSHAGRYSIAAETLSEAFWRAEVADHDAVKIEAAAMLVTVLGVRLSRVAEAEIWERHATAAVELVGRGGREHAAVLTSLGAFAQTSGRFDEAIARTETALAIRERLLGPWHSEVALTRNSLGVALGASGDHERARAEFERALDIASYALGPEHPLVASILNNLGAVTKQLGDFDRAAIYHREAATSLERSLGEHPNLAAALNNLGEVHMRRGDLARARAAVERSLAIRERSSSASPRMIANSATNLGEILRREGDLDAAERIFARSIALLETLADDLPDLAFPLSGLGHIALSRGDQAKAIALLERAHQLQRADLQPGEAATTEFLLARAYDGYDASRSLHLANDALTHYRDAGPAWAAETESVVVWLAEHDASP